MLEGGSTVIHIELICDWLRQNISPLFKYQVPGEIQEIGEAELSNPSVYARYFPVKENLPVSDSVNQDLRKSAPSIVVMPGIISKGYSSAILPVHILYTIWAPGENGSFCYDGWKSLLNMMDETARQLSACGRIGQLAVILDDNGHNIDYGLMNDEDVTPDLRPYYTGFLTISFTYGQKSVLQGQNTKKLLD